MTMCVIWRHVCQLQVWYLSMVLIVCDAIGNTVLSVQHSYTGIGIPALHCINMSEGPNSHRNMSDEHDVLLMLPKPHQSSGLGRSRSVSTLLSLHGKHSVRNHMHLAQNWQKGLKQKRPAASSIWLSTPLLFFTSAPRGRTFVSRSGAAMPDL